MEHKIKSRLLGKALIFAMPDSGGEVTVNGEYICDGGKMEGSIVWASPVTFKGTCKRWYRTFIRQYNQSQVLDLVGS
jgi:hypothetical protein